MSKRVVLFVVTLTILNSCFHIHLNSWLFFPWSSYCSINNLRLAGNDNFTIK